MLINDFGYCNEIFVSLLVNTSCTANTPNNAMLFFKFFYFVDGR